MEDCDLKAMGNENMVPIVACFLSTNSSIYHKRKGLKRALVLCFPIVWFLFIVPNFHATIGTTLCSEL